MSGKTEKSLLLGNPPPPVVRMPVNGPQPGKQMQYGCLSVDMPRPIDDEFVGYYSPLTHKQIAQYAHDPWWLNLRRGLMIAFWASMALMVLSAVLIAIVEHEHVCVAGKSLIAPTTPNPVPMANGTLPTTTTLLAEIPLAGAYLLDGGAVVSDVSKDASVDQHSSIVKWLLHRF